MAMEITKKPGNSLEPLSNAKILTATAALNELLTADNVIDSDMPKSDILDDTESSPRKIVNNLLIEGIKQDADDIKKLDSSESLQLKMFKSFRDCSAMKVFDISESLALDLCVTAFKAINICYEELTGHTDDITCAAMDGDTIVSASKDATIKIWNKNTGNCVRTLVGHTDWVTWVKVDGDLIISASRDNALRVWNKNDGKYLWCALLGPLLQLSKNSLAKVLIDADTVIVYSDTTIKMWDKNTGKLLNTLIGHTDRITDVLVDGDRIISASLDKTVRIWNKHTGQHLHTLSNASGVIKIIVDGDTIISALTDTTIIIWNKISGKRLRWLSSYGSNSIAHRSTITAIIVDGDRIIAGFKNGIIQIWDKNTGKMLQFLDTACGSRISTLRVDGNRIIAGCQNRNLIIWCPKIDENLFTVFRDHNTVMSEDNNKIISTTWDDTIKICDIKTEKVLLEKRIDQQVASLVVDGDKIIAIPLSGKNIRIYDVSECREFEEFIYTLPASTALVLNDPKKTLAPANRMIFQNLLDVIEQRWGQGVMKNVKLALSNRSSSCNVM